MDLRTDIDCFLLDLDGTVYFGSRPIEGAIDAIARMQRDKRVIFLTNNSSATRTYYVNKLRKMGITLSERDVCTSANATSFWIRHNRPDARAYIVASEEVTEEFRASGVRTDGEPDTVIVTFDKTLTYEKLVRATDLIAKGAFYIATHPDMTCPVENGELPDIGSFMRLIEGTTNRLPDVICGKPYAPIADCVSAMTGIEKPRIAMVGDRLYTDMKFAINNGLKAVLTLTGVTDEAAYRACGFEVDAVIGSVAEWDL